MTLPAFFHDIGGVVGRTLLDRAGFLGAAHGRHLAAKSAENDGDEGAVHRLAHDVGEDRADEPTSAPVMINARLPSVKPMPAAAQPEYELSIDTTTGMSAPPIGMISVTPTTSESAISRNSQIPLSEPTNSAMQASIPDAQQNVDRMALGQQYRLAVIRSESFRRR